MTFAESRKQQKKKLERENHNMLGGFRNIVKASFKKRFIICYCLLLSLFFFGSFPFAFVQIVASGTFVITSILFLTIFTFQFKYQIGQLFAHRSREKLERVPQDVEELSKQIGAEVKNFGIVKDCTAYVIGKSLVAGIDLLRILDFDERQAVVAHELGHIKEHHGFYRAIAILPLFGLTLYIFSRMRMPIILTMPLTQFIMTVMLNIAGLAFILVATIPINWYLEFRADRIAAKFVGREYIKSALTKLAKNMNHKVDEPSETHPSITERIKELDRLKL
jgi:Zn-dependent protease with chaperone function